MTVEEARYIFERNGYEFRYAKTAYRFPFEGTQWQHHFITRRLKDNANVCRQIVGDDYSYCIEVLIDNTEHMDDNFKLEFPEDKVVKLLKAIDDEQTR